MIEQGAKTEVVTILARKLDKGLPVMKAIGVSQSLVSTALDESWRTLCQRDSRRFAKRQKTYFRKYAHNWAWFSRLEGDSVNKLEEYVAGH